MIKKSGWALLALFCAVFISTSLLAQADSCIVQVFYGAGGRDSGDCLDASTSLCATHEYALKQGKQICPQEVQLFAENLLREVYRSPDNIQRAPFDWAIAVLYGLLPWVVGGLGGWWLAHWS